MKVECYHAPYNNMFYEGLVYEAKQHETSPRLIVITDSLGHERSANLQYKKHALNGQDIPYYVFMVRNNREDSNTDLNMARFHIIKEGE